jgi:hypothetical protein
MATARQIPAGELVKDLRSGMSAAELMAKYAISAEELRHLLKQLENVGASTSKLYGRTPEEPLSELIKRIRLLPRYKVTLPVPIHDADDPSVSGIVIDINEKGLGTEGIEAKPGQVRRFFILADQFFPIDAFKLEAKCRWVKATGDERRFIAGFQITTIGQRAFQNLRSFIQSLSRAEEAHKTVATSGLYAFRSTYGEQVSTIWTCPFCKMPQPREYDECPQCGIIASKYQRQRTRTKTEIIDLMDVDLPGPPPPTSLTSSFLNKTETVTKTIRVPARLWQQLEILGGNIDAHVTKALSAYLLRVGTGWTKK